MKIGTKVCFKADNKEAIIVKFDLQFDNIVHVVDEDGLEWECFKQELEVIDVQSK